MVVRIRFHYENAVRRTAALNRQATGLASSLLTPVAFTAWALGGWRLLADLKITGDFAISSGLFSHWQVWIALGVVLQVAAFLLQRAAATASMSSTGVQLNRTDSSRVEVHVAREVEVDR
jgi:hypothetical protein